MRMMDELDAELYPTPVQNTLTEKEQEIRENDFSAHDKKKPTVDSKWYKNWSK